MDPEHPSLREDWDLQPKQPAAHEPPSGRRYPSDTAWTVPTHDVPAIRHKGTLRYALTLRGGIPGPLWQCSWGRHGAGRTPAGFLQASGRRYAPAMGLTRDDVLPEVSHRYVDARGLRMHVAEAGTGPLVLLLHGFPECWYSCRHQLVALAEAGYHAVAPDQRGYCRTGGPEAVDQYTMLHLTGDIVALMDALGEPRAVVAGHDWGAPVAWHTALLRPDRVRGVIGLSVPYRPRGSSAPIAAMRSTLGNGFYMIYSSSRESPTPSSPPIRGRPSPGCSTVLPATRPPWRRSSRRAADSSTSAPS